MTKQLGELNNPDITTDGIYGDVMAPVEQGMDMFYRSDIKTTKGSIEGTECNTTLIKQEVLEGILNNFGKTTNGVTYQVDEDSSVEGLESFGERAMVVIRNLIQMVKDFVAWLGSLINNKLTRLDNRQFRMASRRKRFGLKTEDVKYPSVVKRLMVPNKVTADGQWVKESIKAVHDFYKQSASVFAQLTSLITFDVNWFDYQTQVSYVNNAIINGFGLSKDKSDKDGVVTYISDVLPGNRYFQFAANPDGPRNPVSMFFNDTTMDVKLVSPTFGPTSFIIDKTLDEISSTINTIRKTQKTVGDVHRQFEKQVIAFQNKNGAKITSEQRLYLSWILAVSKRLSQVTIQYLTSSLDAGMDFVQAGIKE